MPLIIRTPENAGVIARWGTYPQRINVLDRQETATQRMLHRDGLAGYEPLTLAAVLALMQEAPIGAVFFDVGAHIGLYSALVSAIFANKGVRTFAFEPTPDTAAIARRLGRYNELGFEVVQAALSGAPGTATLYVSDMVETANSLHARHRNHASTVTVEVDTLDAFATRRRVDPTVIKIDVEGSEPEVLAGAFATIDRRRSAIVCEIAGERSARAIAAQVATLERLGYQSYPVTTSMPWRPASPPEIGRLAIDEDVHSWLFLPQPLTRALSHAVETWAAAIAECGERTNLLVPGGTPPPVLWNAGHPIPAQRSIRERWLER